MEVLHLLNEVLGDGHVLVGVLVVSHFLASFSISSLDFLLLFVDDSVSVVLAIETTVLDRLDKFVESERVLLNQVLKTTWLSEFELEYALLQVVLLEAMAHLKHFKSCIVGLV